MYHYDKTIEKFDDYKLFLAKVEWPTKGYQFSLPSLPEDFLNKYASLLNRFAVIDKLVEGYNESLAYKEDARNISYEEWYERWNYFSWQEELDRPSKIFSDMNASSIEYLFDYYDICCNFFLTLFPNYKDFLLETKSMLDNAFNDLNARIYLKQNNQNQNKQIVMKWSKGWFILPNGEFYNPGLEKGHKEGRLIYSLNNIKGLLEEGKNIPNLNYDKRIKTILNRGFITADEFENYANLIYALPSSILTLDDIENLKYSENYYKYGPKKEADLKKIILPRKSKTVEVYPLEDVPIIKSYYGGRRTYQPNIVRLVVGYLAAKGYLYKSFWRLNNSNKKQEIFANLFKLSCQDRNDLFVRFCGFHKIETCEKKITTSSLYGVDLFKEYLDRGYDLYIIPPIVYDAYLDDLQELDFSSCYVNKHFDKVLSEYEGKGRVLIRNKNC